MTDPLSSRPVPLAQTREAVIRQLAMHFAVDNLTAEQLEQRIDQAHAATSLEVLRGLVADLPVMADPPGVPAAASSDDGFSRVRAEQVPGRQLVAGIMGGAERKGIWTPPGELTAIAAMGGVVLDFRQARFGPGVTVVHALALMGGVEIIVPPGIQVETNGLGLMGGFASAGDVTVQPRSDAPVLRVGGLALMGAVEIEVRRVGEGASDARRRRRLERREARRLSRGK
jgi:hypothetical protein